MVSYTLSSGEMIDISLLSEKERKHISKIEELIGNNTDYIEIYSRAFTPLLVGKTFDGDSFKALRDSSQYKILLDLLESYHKKCFSK